MKKINFLILIVSVFIANFIILQINEVGANSLNFFRSGSVSSITGFQFAGKVKGVKSVELSVLEGGGYDCEKNTLDGSTVEIQAFVGQEGGYFIHQNVHPSTPHKTLPEIGQSIMGRTREPNKEIVCKKYDEEGKLIAEETLSLPNIEIYANSK